MLHRQRPPAPEATDSNPSSRHSKRMGCFNPPLFLISILVGIGGVGRYTWQRLNPSADQYYCTAVLMIRGGGLVNRYLCFCYKLRFSLLTLSGSQGSPRTPLPPVSASRQPTWRYDDSNDDRDREKRRGRLYQMHNLPMGRLVVPLGVDEPVQWQETAQLRSHSIRSASRYAPHKDGAGSPPRPCPALVSAGWHPAPLPTMDANHYQFSRPVNTGGKSWLVDPIIPPPSRSWSRHSRPPIHRDIPHLLAERRVQ